MDPSCLAVWYVPLGNDTKLLSLISPVGLSDNFLTSPYQHSCHTGCNGRSEEGGTFYKWSSIWALPPAGWWGSPWFAVGGDTLRILRYLKIEKTHWDLHAWSKQVMHEALKWINKGWQNIHKAVSSICAFQLWQRVSCLGLGLLCNNTHTHVPQRSPIWQSSFTPSVPQHVFNSRVCLTYLLLYVCCFIWGGPW